MKAFAISALAVASAVSYFGCGETRRTLGEDCLKNEDCLSAICSSLKCAAAPPILGSAPPATDAGPSVLPDAGQDTGAADAGGDATGDAASD